jgi:transcriptional regulator with XRE-family HTH domain
VTSDEGATSFEGVLRAARVRSGLSQRALARRMKCCSSSVVRIEAGKHRLLESTIQRYAEALGLRAELRLVEVEEAPCPTT